MNAAAAERCVSQLTEARGRSEIGRTLVRFLAEEYHADAVIAWLPSSPTARPEAADIFVDGSTSADRSAAEIAVALSGDALQEWFMGRGAGCYVDAECLPFVRRIALTWQQTALPDPHLAPSLELLAALSASLIELRRAEERVVSLTEELRDGECQLLQTRRVQTVGDLAIGFVHDFNNSLTTILGLTEVVLEPGLVDPRLHADLTTIQTAALEAAAVVKRLQMLGRQARAHETRDVVDLADIVKALPDLVRSRRITRAHDQGVSFDLVVDSSPAPPVRVVVAEIRELLLNLLSNAIDAMPSGGRITLTVAGADDGVQVSVTDEGAGMSDDVRARLFEPFFTTKGAYASGLGLSACQNIAKRHGGVLHIESTTGAGTTVTLRLPPAPVRLLDTGVPAGDGEPPLETATRLTGDRPQAGSLRVLLVDDQDDVRDSMGEMVRALGHQVWTAPGGEVALETLRHQSVDVVITDLGMPEMNGLDLAGQMGPIAPETVVLLMSGWDMEEDAERPRNIVGLLGKPVTMTALRDAIAGCASDAQRRRVRCS